MPGRPTRRDPGSHANRIAIPAAPTAPAGMTTTPSPAPPSGAPDLLDPTHRFRDSAADVPPALVRLPRAAGPVDGAAGADHPLLRPAQRAEGDAALLADLGRWRAQILRLVGVSCRTIGEANRPDEPALYVANHQSTFETIASAVLVPDVAIILKEELYRIPVFGWFLEEIPDDRHRPRRRRHGDEEDVPRGPRGRSRRAQPADLPGRHPPAGRHARADAARRGAALQGARPAGGTDGAQCRAVLAGAQLRDQARRDHRLLPAADPGRPAGDRVHGAAFHGDL